MHSAPLLTGWDTAVFILPFFGLLFLWMFGLDELLAAPGANARRRPFCQVGNGKDAGMTDPDGTPWPRALAGECGMLPAITPPIPAAATSGSSASRSETKTYHTACCRFASPSEARKRSAKNC